MKGFPVLLRALDVWTQQCTDMKGFYCSPNKVCAWAVRVSIQALTTSGNSLLHDTYRHYLTFINEGMLMKCLEENAARWAYAEEFSLKISCNPT